MRRGPHPQVARRRMRALSTKKLDPVLCSDGAEVERRAARRAATRRRRTDDLINERIEHAAGGRDHQLATRLRTKTLDAVRRAAWGEKHVAGGQLQGLVAELRLVSAFADDVRFVITRVTMQAGARPRWLYRLAQGVGTPGVCRACLKG